VGLGRPGPPPVSPPARGTVLLLLGEKAGLREDEQTNFVFSPPSPLILSPRRGNHLARFRLEGSVEKAFDTSAITVALCIGWPDSPSLMKIRNNQSQRLMTPARVYLFSCDLAPAPYVNTLGNVLRNLTGEIWDFLPTCARALESRFKLDQVARGIAFCRLETNATAEEKVNFPQFLRHTDNRLDRLRTWARAELANQHNGKQLPECALDIFTGRIRPVAHILMDLLSD
jgi:hypothetical protein